MTQKVIKKGYAPETVQQEVVVADASTSSRTASTAVATLLANPSPSPPQARLEGGRQKGGP